MNIGAKIGRLRDWYYVKVRGYHKHDFCQVSSDTRRGMLRIHTTYTYRCQGCDSIFSSDTRNMRLPSWMESPYEKLEEKVNRE